MYSFSSGWSLPKQCMKTRLISFGPLFRMKRLIRMPAMSGGRGTAISGSRPTMMRVGVVARMAPAPGRRLAQHHEGGDLVDRVVHPARLEGGAVAAFVPARVGRRAVEDAVGDEAGDGPPRAPGQVAEPAGHDESGEPDDGIADRRPVLPLHQLLQALARDRAGIPTGRRKSALDGPLVLGPGKAVVAWGELDAHCTL